MNISDYRQEIKLKLTGDYLESELDDDTIDKIIQSALRELQRYITSTRIITIPYENCIDLSKVKDADGKYLDVNSVVMIYRTEDLSGANVSSGITDPMQVAQWQLISGMGNLTNFQDAVWNYAGWTTLGQIRNTISTDLSFRFDDHTNKLYINTSAGTPQKITVEYIPKLHSVEEITSAYWIDMLMRLSVALTKITIGRIRTRYTQSNALWVQDGDTILSEGRDELTSIREMLLANTDLYYPID